MGLHEAPATRGAGHLAHERRRRLKQRVLLAVLAVGRLDHGVA